MIPTERYKNDVFFKNLVDMIRSFLASYDTTPSELREALWLAMAMHESQNIRPLCQANPDGSFTVWERGKKS